MRETSEIASNIIESQTVFENDNKYSEVSKSEITNLANIPQGETSDLHLTVYKEYFPTDNVKYQTHSKRKITVKDFIFFLEKEKRTPLQNLLLHKATIKLNQYLSH